MESLPRTEAPPPATDPASGPDAADDEHGAPHLADPRALQILSTEHWSLLTARSLVYNEAFSRASMFLTFLSASLVALGFLLGPAGRDFVYILIAILSLDIFVGVATLGRLQDSGIEEFFALQGMNRIRHAYLEMVPPLEPYFTTSHYDDPGSILQIYGATPQDPGLLLNMAHGFTTIPGMIGVLVSALTGALVAAIASALGGDVRTSMVAGLVGGVLAFLVMIAVMIRAFARVQGTFVPRFPAPDAAVRQPPGRRNT